MRERERGKQSVLVKEVIKKLNKNKIFSPSIFIQMSENIAPHRDFWMMLKQIFS